MHHRKLVQFFRSEYKICVYKNTYMCAFVAVCTSGPSESAPVCSCVYITYHHQHPYRSDDVAFAAMCAQHVLETANVCAVLCHTHHCHIRWASIRADSNLCYGEKKHRKKKIGKIVFVLRPGTPQTATKKLCAKKMQLPTHENAKLNLETRAMRKSFFSAHILSLSPQIGPKLISYKSELLSGCGCIKKRIRVDSRSTVDWFNKKLNQLSVSVRLFG